MYNKNSDVFLSLWQGTKRVIGGNNNDYEYSFPETKFLHAINVCMDTQHER